MKIFSFQEGGDAMMLCSAGPSRVTTILIKSVTEHCNSKSIYIFSLAQLLQRSFKIVRPDRMLPTTHDIVRT